MSMYISSDITICRLLIIIILINSITLNDSTTISISVPSTTLWVQNGTTIAGIGNGTAGTSNSSLGAPRGIAISNDILYVPDWSNNRIVMVNLNTSKVTIFGSGPGNTTSTLYKPYDVLIVGTSLYILDTANYRIQQWTTSGTPTRSNAVPYGTIKYSYNMFIDQYNYFYVSQSVDNTVVRVRMNSSSATVIAGTGTAGSAADQLNSQTGIFVDSARTLYIADYGNHRIQMWTYGASSGQTVAGTGVAGSSLTQLGLPTAVIMDSNQYMYITDQGNDRVLRWLVNAPSGICIVGCTHSNGSRMDQLYAPVSMAFDSNGSFYVSDYYNRRVQKFQVYTNQIQTTSTHQTTSKPTVLTTGLTSTVQTSSSHPTTTILTSTMLHTSKSPIQTTIKTTTTTTTTTTTSTSTTTTTTTTTKGQSTIVPSTVLIQATTAKPPSTLNLFTTSHMPSTYNGIATSTSSVHSTIIVQSTITSTITLLQPITSKPMIAPSVSSTDNHVKTSTSSLHSATIVQSTTTTALPEITTSKSFIPSQISSNNNYMETTTPSTSLSVIQQSTMTLSETLSEVTASTKSFNTLKGLSTNDNIESSKSSMDSTTTTTVQSTIISTASSLDSTTLKTFMASPTSSNNVQVESSTVSAHLTTAQTTMISTTLATTSKILVTTQISSIDNHVQTSTSSLHSTTIVQSTTTTTLPEITTSKSFITSQISSNNNYMETTAPSTSLSVIQQSTVTLSATLSEVTASTESFDTSEGLSTNDNIGSSTSSMDSTTLKTFMASQISTNNVQVESSTISAHLTTAQTIMISTTSKTLATTQISSTTNNIETSISSGHSSPTMQSIIPSIDPLSKMTSSKAMITSFTTLATSQSTNKVSTKSLSTISQKISSRKTTLSDLFSALSTGSITELSTSRLSQADNSTTASNVLLSTLSTSAQNCSNDTILLWPNNPLVTVPFEIERSEDFSISSKLYLNCFQSLPVIEQWFVEKCLNNSLCSIREPVVLLPSIKTKLGELFLPSKTLEYGIYQMKLSAQMSNLFQVVASAITYIKIIPSPVEVYLVEFRQSMIIRGQQQIIQLDPGRFSIDPDQSYFNSSNWNYVYYCGIYMSENVNLRRIDSLTSSCFDNASGNKTLWQYGSNTSQSSVIISAGSLQSNQTYYFKVNLTNIQNSSISYSGDLLIQIEQNISMSIIVECIISTLCISKNEYQTINPTTQIALTSFCVDNCYNLSSNIDIRWNIYYGILNSTNQIVQWILLENTTQYMNNWIFGMNSSNITVIKDFLLAYSTIEYWRLEVIYSVGSIRSTGLINFMVNSPPSNGTCSIDPLNGTTTTLFTMTCLNWFDSNGIKDYSFYTWTTDRRNRLMLAYNTSSTFQVRMPIGDVNTTLLQIVVRVRDNYDCTTEFNLTAISVILDMSNIISLITTNDQMTSNPLVRTLYSGNQNDVCQVLTSVGQIINILAEQNLQLAIDRDNLSAVAVSISPLTNEYSLINNHPRIFYNDIFNFTDYSQQLNTFAAAEEYLMLFIDNLTITTIDSVTLQGSTLSELTSMTNQLTRNSLIIASTRCFELSQALLNYAQRIPYEDVQTASTYIVQCASNVLTAVNAPIQERVIVLDLDTNRANAFPANYDTDLEYIWSNPNLFADGDDFSQETIDKNRNIYYQRQTAQIINNQFEQTMVMITSALHKHLNINQTISVNTSSIVMSMTRMKVETLSNQMVNLNENTKISLPKRYFLNSTVDSIISFRCVETPLAIAGNPPESNMNLSNLVLITIFDENIDEIPIHTTSEEPIEFFVARDINLIVPSMVLQNVSSIINDPLINNRQFNLHFINITHINSNISVSVHLEMHPLNNTLGYMLIYKFDEIPQLDSSIQRIDGWSMLCPQNMDVLNFFIDNEKTVGHQSTIFGIRELNSTEFDMYCVNMSSDILITDQLFDFSANYELRIFISGCYYLDINNNWQSDGLLVGSLTNSNRTQCFSTHLSTFAGGFVVLPTPVNWNYVFTHADFMKNKTIYLTIIIIMVIFLILLIYARYLDKKDNEKIIVTVLPDMQSGDNYYYQMAVFTGTRKNAGTDSKVHFVLSSDSYETNIRSLINPNMKLLQRGSVNSFIFGVPRPLTLMNHLHIWHDNSGKDGSWFLKYIIIRDLQTMQKYYFICQQWLSVDKGDGKIERLLPVSSEDEMRQLVHSFSRKAHDNLSDDHLWYSIFSPPSTTKFTRVQRCTCCFVFLYTAMLLSILYYDQSDTISSDSLSFGPFYFTKQEIVIGVIVDILTIIPSIFLVGLFRRIRQRRSSKDALSLADIISKIGNNATPNTNAFQSPMKKKNRRLFPWWFLFIAYGFSYLLIGVSILFIIARGIEFGDTKTHQWLTSMIVGFFSSVLLSQPIKVVGLTIFFVLINRRFKIKKKSDDIMNETEEFYLNGDDKHIQTIDTVTMVNQRFHDVRPLSRRQVAESRFIRLRNIKMRSFVQHLLIHTCYLSMLYTISYANRNRHSYEQVNHLRHFFLNPHRSTYNYMEISTTNEYWQWLQNSFVENIRSQAWYNGDLPQGLSGLINDKTNRLIGWPIMRQLRLKSNSTTCRVPISMRQILSKCNGDYSLSNEDRQSWLPGWKLTTDNRSHPESIQNAFIYQSADKFGSYRYEGILDTYDSGGYVYEFRGRLDEMKSNLSALYELSWIDSLTRGIILEMTLVNVNVRLFTSVTFLIEFLSTSGVIVETRFEPVDLHNEFQGSSSLIHAICGVIYMLFIIYFMLIEIRSIIKLKKRYFYSTWSLIQWCIIIGSWIGCGIYIWRLKQGSQLETLFDETNGYKYVNIHRAVYLENILKFLFGFCCFFGTIKFVGLFHFNSYLIQFEKTLQYVKKDLLYFTGLFGIVFVSFVSLFYLLFFSKILSCSNVFYTAEMLSQVLLFKFNTRDLYEADAFLGPLAFILFIYLVVFVCCTMFISIVNNGFRHVRRTMKLKLNDDENVLLFIFFKIKCALGIVKKNESNKQQHALEDLADKIDQLASAVNKSKTILSNRSRIITPAKPLNDIYVEDID